MVNPRLMCRKHLLGEHFEIHMFLGTMRKGIDVTGYVKNNLLDVSSLFSRHEEISNEMIRRGYNHNTPISLEEVSFILNCEPYKYLKFDYIDKEESISELIKRCKDCRSMIQ